MVTYNQSLGRQDCASPRLFSCFAFCVGLAMQLAYKFNCGKISYYQVVFSICVCVCVCTHVTILVMLMLTMEKTRKRVHLMAAFFLNWFCRTCFHFLDPFWGNPVKHTGTFLSSRVWGRVRTCRYFSLVHKMIDMLEVNKYATSLLEQLIDLEGSLRNGGVLCFLYRITATSLIPSVLSLIRFVFISSIPSFSACLKAHCLKTGQRWTLQPTENSSEDYGW